MGARTNRDPTESLGGSVLNRINRRLARIEDELTAGFDGPELPLVFILGPPRSGTTLMSQLLANRGGFAYVSNFLARFWLAPFVGSLLEQQIGIRAHGTRTSFHSRFGATRDPAEPHEFTYFWNRWFDYGQPGQKLTACQLGRIDAVALRRSIGGIERAWRAPVVFKNSFWHNFQVEFLAELFPCSVFVQCRRDPLYTAQSIALARDAICGDRASWWSMRPPGFEMLLDRPWSEQIAGQVMFTEREIERSVTTLPTDRVIQAEYSHVCSDPVAIVERVDTAVAAFGVELPAPADSPAGFEPTDIPRLSPDELAELRAALDRFARSTPPGASY